MDDIDNTQKSFFEYVENSIIKNNKISHAYLIETRGYNNYNQVISKFIKLILSANKNGDEQDKISTLIDSNNYPDLKYIYPDGAYIKKEQLIQLENQYMKKSMMDNKLIYVIDPADKLNQSSANTILKFLEEPPEDIVAILITENKYMVLETIVSRCQVLSLKNNTEESFSEEIIEFGDELFLPKKVLIKYDYYLESLFFDRNSAINTLKVVEEYLFKKLKESTDQETLIVKMIEIIEKEKEKLNYNVNMKLWFSNFIFNIMEVSSNA